MRTLSRVVFISLSIPVLLCFILTSNVNAATKGLVIDYSAVALFDSLTDEQVLTASRVEVLIRHASVGSNISGGLDSLYVKDSRFDRINFTFQERGNPGWQEKLQDLVGQAALYQSSYGAMGMKFCYIDASADSNTYISVMNSLEDEYPSKAIIWWTMPTGTIDNVASIAVFNKAVREYAVKNNKILFDLASIESHTNDGKACVTEGGVENMCSEYTSDGGHLNHFGSERVAKAFWVLMAGIGSNVGISGETNNRNTTNQSVDDSVKEAGNQEASRVEMTFPWLGLLIISCSLVTLIFLLAKSKKISN